MAGKLDKLELRLYRTMRNIREAETPRDMLDKIRRFGKLEALYHKISGQQFVPNVNYIENEMQDIEW